MPRAASAIVVAMSGGLPYGSLAWGLPFVGLLLTLAIAPLGVPGLWNRHYGKIVALWGLVFVVPDVVAEGASASFTRLLDMALNTYVPFVLLLGALFIITGGLRIRGAPHGSPGVNTALLALSTVASSLIGTPGASLLMLRPLVRANRHRTRAGHVYVFFIFLVCNVGGALTPLGNPPLFLGYLRGVPFFWPAQHLWLPTILLSVALLAMFFFIDHYRFGRHEPAVLPELEKLGIDGAINLLLLLGAAVTMMLRTYYPVPGAIAVFGVTWSFDDILSDALFVALALLSLRLTKPATRQENTFVWTPIVEVSILFAGIFVTLVPIDAIMAAGTAGPAAPLLAQVFVGGAPNNALFYLLPGVLSSILDNAPAYLVFFGLAGDNATLLSGKLALTLAAISAGASYFGAMTYIGNAPNLMVKSVVESYGVKMPNFFAYIGWSVVCLLPLLLVTAWIFFR
ncbi:MAG TPA: sodium:proton antiporter [Xanthobacteraceae bacterium]|nr:sodium:proton antiporter [Xanthobacteraceae bacterium]